MVSRFMRSSPKLGASLSMESAWESLSSSLYPSPQLMHALSLCLSLKIHKHFKKKRERERDSGTETYSWHQHLSPQGELQTILMNRKIAKNNGPSTVRVSLRLWSWTRMDGAPRSPLDSEYSCVLSSKLQTECVYLEETGDLGSFCGSRQSMKSKDVEGSLILKVQYWLLECQGHE